MCNKQVTSIGAWGLRVASLVQYAGQLVPTYSKFALGAFKRRECVLTRLSHIGLCSVRSSHLPFKKHLVGYVRPYIDACQVNSNPFKRNISTRL